MRVFGDYKGVGLGRCFGCTGEEPSFIAQMQQVIQRRASVPSRGPARSFGVPQSRFGKGGAWWGMAQARARAVQQRQRQGQRQVQGLGDPIAILRSAMPGAW